MPPTGPPPDVVEDDDDSLDGAGAATLPEAAERRLRSPAFSSDLTVNEFAACLHLGLRPVGLVQGFCVMRWQWDTYSMGLYANGYGSTYSSRSRNYGWTYGSRVLTSYNCPHPYIGTSDEHPRYGRNVELGSMEKAWSYGFSTSLRRLVAEASELGAHGVLGIVDRSRSLIDSKLHEFHLVGTAVVAEGQPAPTSPWTTFLAGQRLNKLLEAGQLPVSVVGALAAVAVIPSCVTEYRENGRFDPYGQVNPEGEITQLADAQMSVRRVARDRVRGLLGNDTLHGADLQVHRGAVGGRSSYLATLTGTRVRQFRDVEPLPTPTPTVRLS